MTAKSDKSKQLEEAYRNATVEGIKYNAGLFEDLSDREIAIEIMHNQYNNYDLRVSIRTLFNLLVSKGVITQEELAQELEASFKSEMDSLKGNKLHNRKGENE